MLFIRKSFFIVFLLCFSSCNIVQEKLKNIYLISFENFVNEVEQNCLDYDKNIRIIIINCSMKRKKEK